MLSRQNLVAVFVPHLAVIQLLKLLASKLEAKMLARNIRCIAMDNKVRTMSSEELLPRYYTCRAVVNDPVFVLSSGAWEILVDDAPVAIVSRASFG